MCETIVGPEPGGTAELVVVGLDIPLSSDSRVTARLLPAIKNREELPRDRRTTTSGENDRTEEKSSSGGSLSGS